GGFMTGTSTSTELMTADEFLAWCERPENAEHHYELDRGRIVQMGAPGVRHGAICWIVGHWIGLYLFRRGSGYATSNDAGLIVSRSPDTVRGPDLMIFLDSTPYSQLSVRPAETVPAVVIEVRSPSDSWKQMSRRVQQYLTAGVQLVWVIDPEEETVYVHRQGEFQRVLDSTDLLSGNGILPELSLPVADLFRLPGEPPV
ncbi:MAG: Uma2 family endonuclease, partial [Gemmataceae bacterium]